MVLVFNISTSVKANTYSIFAGGDGSESNPYQIATADQLNEIRYYLDKHFIQVADIDLSYATASGGDYYDAGNGWLPIGSSSEPFTGTYNGANYAITGMKINRTATPSLYAGLFGFLSGTVHNLKLNCDINVGSSSVSSFVSVGGICGYMANGSSILNCTVTGEISGSSQSYLHVGGITGTSTDDILISNCINRAALNVFGANDIFTGGIVGETTANGKKKDTVISECNNWGFISVVSTSNEYDSISTGGIVGYNDNGCSLKLISNENDADLSIVASSFVCSGGILGYTRVGNTILTKNNNDGNVEVRAGNGTYKTPKYYTGGIVGSPQSGDNSSYQVTIEKCYNSADISCSSASTSSVSSTNYVGGICAFVWNGVDINNCYNIGALSISKSSSAYVGGIVGASQNENGIFNCYNTGNMEISSSKNSMIGAISAWSSGVIGNCYWNIQSSQVIGGVTRGADEKLGIEKLYSNEDENITTSLSPAVMKSIQFVDILNSYCNGAIVWTVAEDGNNGGYPILMDEYTYTEIFYIQNANDDGYAIYEQSSVVATLGATATATVKTYEGFEENHSLGTHSGIVSADNSLILSRYYDRKYYTITFDTNGGVILPGLTAKYGADISLPTPSRYGYSFEGWYTDSSLTNKADVSKMPIDGAILYAKWNSLSSSSRGTEYKINSLTLRNTSNYEKIDSIPSSNFIAEISVTNLSSVCTDTIIVVTYDENGAMIDMTYMYASIDIGETTALGTLIKNTDGNVSKVKAFVWSTLNSLKPLAESVEICK